MRIEKKQLEIESLPDGSPVILSYLQIQGKPSKKKAAIIATQHGDEFFSIAIINSFITSLTSFDGELLIFPVANPLAFNIRRRRNMIDRQDMNRMWPGKKDGTLTQQLCYHIFRTIKDCDCVLDLHNGNEHTLVAPQARMSEKQQQKERDLAKNLGVSFVVPSGLKGQNTLIHTLNKHGIPGVTIEIGEGQRIDTTFIKKGVHIIRNFLAYNRMLPKAVGQKKTLFFKQDGYEYMRAEEGGLFIPNLEALGKKTQLLGELTSFADYTTKQIKLESPKYILSLFVSGVISEGHIIARISKD